MGVNVNFVVVRLEGNNAELGAKKLADSGLNIIAKGLTDAAQQVVAAVEEIMPILIDKNGFKVICQGFTGSRDFPLNRPLHTALKWLAA